ncbi:hypothetical protein M407DRAFT_191414 [Tulasnella calospora MUT 4182]|uniref:Uncharacterized protein n=1 Tax=Tulasnella calospora MUT 4182 TaxID=1051891 RepID=A0A0C3Q158_9AGAM|nr:hypothetical protein M407DRAFT_191414 [Tulasnella calospora MUT 4182]
MDFNDSFTVHTSTCSPRALVFSNSNVKPFYKPALCCQCPVQTKGGEHLGWFAGGRPDGSTRLYTGQPEIQRRAMVFVSRID